VKAENLNPEVEELCNEPVEELCNEPVEELCNEWLQVQHRRSRSRRRGYLSNNFDYSMGSVKHYQRSSASRRMSSAQSTMKAFQMHNFFRCCPLLLAFFNASYWMRKPASNESSLFEEKDSDEEKVALLKDEHFETFKMIWTISIKKLQRKKVMIQENSQPHTLYEEAKKAGVSQNKWQSWLRKRLTKLMLRVVFSNSEEQSLQVNMHCTYKELLITLASKLSTEAGKIVVKVDDKTLNVPDSQADVTLLTSLGLKNGSLLVVTC